jgi:hypothetical protein
LGYVPERGHDVGGDDVGVAEVDDQAVAHLPFQKDLLPVGIEETRGCRYEP